MRGILVSEIYIFLTKKVGKIKGGFSKLLDSRKAEAPETLVHLGGEHALTGPQIQEYNSICVLTCKLQ